MNGLGRAGIPQMTQDSPTSGILKITANPVQVVKMNITGAWNIADGTGVLISVVDDGVETDHPDLSPNYKTSLDYDYCGNDNNPNPSNDKAHGTNSAGVATAIGDNGIGGTGATMNADLIGIRLIDCSLSDTREANALGHSRSEIDISSNSWGPTDDGQTLEGPGPLLLNSLEKNVYEGRDGKHHHHIGRWKWAFR